MKFLIVIGLGWAVVSSAGRAAEETFSKSVRAEEFAAAGLTKLSAVELARLDALVRDYRGAAAELAVARREAAAATEARVTAEAKAARAEAKVALVGPAADAVIESRIAGDFVGWEGRTVFVLENGQRWQVANSGSYYAPKRTAPKVKLTPAAMGGHWMAIEGVGTRVKVVAAGAK